MMKWDNLYYRWLLLKIISNETNEALQCWREFRPTQMDLKTRDPQTLTVARVIESLQWISMRGAQIYMWIGRSFVCLFVCCLSSHSRIFHSCGDVIITGEGLQNFFTYARHWWSLNSEGFLACNTYCGTGHPFRIVISEDLWHSHLLPSVWQWSCHYLFLRLSVAVGITIHNLPLAGPMLYPTAPPPLSKSIIE